MTNSVVQGGVYMKKRSPSLKKRETQLKNKEKGRDTGSLSAEGLKGPPFG